jgi:hypothetical protein
MKKFFLTATFFAAAFAAFATTTPTPAPHNTHHLVAVGTCVFEDEHSSNDVLYSPENVMPATKGFHRLSVTNIQTGEFMTSHPFTLHQFATTYSLPVIQPAPEVIDLEMITER